MTKKYTTNDISQLDPLDHIRLRPSMYIGSSETPTHLLIECLDNSVDEVQNGFADKILVSINNKTGEFIVADTGRGLPFDYKLSLLDDPPILICNSIFTSGKYKKDNEDSAYKVAAGLHGVGLTCVNALSEYMNIDIFKDGKHGSYSFKYKEEPKRNPIKDKKDPKFSTVFTVKPHSKYFESLKINETVVRERLIIAASNFPNLVIALKIDDDIEYIKGSENNLIEKYLGKDVEQWHEFESSNQNKLKSHENCVVKFGWDFSNNSTKMETFTTVNFVKVESGVHIKKVTDIIENVFQKLAKKNKFEFNSNDALNWLRLYINLKIVNVEFESQTKEKLSKKTDLSVMDTIESKIENYFKKYENINYLLEKFEFYRNSMQNKKITKGNDSGKRGLTSLTKLRDCTMAGGELLIGEGESAVGGLIQTRNPKKHAILPLRGVTINATTKKLSDILQNDVVSNIIKAIGCGITPHCDLSKLRYKKIILAADADPAGEFITALLITLFAKITPELIKNNNLYICKTPLYGHGFNSKFKPIWSDEELEELKSNNIKIRRFKGLGQFNPSELKTVTLDEDTRKLELVKWDDDMCKKLFDVMSDSSLKRKLVMDEYEY